jgi:tetratricopeptide (TPR) repeat protein
MEFKLKPFSKNLYPKSAVLVANASPRFWLQEIQRMDIILKEVAIYPIPSSVVNELYGCLIVFKNLPKEIDFGQNILFQKIHNKLFIPENSIVTPAISLSEMEQVFSEHFHIFHPNFGLVELENEVNWKEIISDIEEVPAKIIVPAKSVLVPKAITSLRIEVDEEAILKQLETPETEKEILENLPFDMKKVLSGNQKEMDKFLSYLDKHPEMALQLGIPLDVMNTSRGDASGRFSFDKKESRWFNFGNFFGNGKSSSTYNTSGSGSGTFGNFDSDSSKNFRYGFLKIIFILFILIKVVNFGLIGEILKWLFVIGIVVGVLYYIFKLKNENSDNEYAKVPNYSNNESSRYINYNSSKKSSWDNYFVAIIVAIIIGMSFLFVKFIGSDIIDKSISPIVYLLGYFILVFLVIFFVVNLFNNLEKNFSNRYLSRSNSGNAALLDSDRFSSLHAKYEKLALDFISKHEYEKAAHVYLKLLQNKLKAAQVLENGKLYQEAAIVYLTHCQDKAKAAECYEKGKAYKEAIALYKEFNMIEKVGDLYVLMNQKKTADEYFYKVADDYKANFQYVKASLILRNKVGNISQGQDMLLEGWRSNRDAANCLNNYFYNIDNEKQLKKEIFRVYNHETAHESLELFLTVIKKEYEKSEDLKVLTKDIAYEIVEKRIHKNPQVASELIFFNKMDKNITKDVMKYKFNRKNNI